MRISECAGILLENVNMDKQTALILGNGAKWRLVPFDDKAALAVSRYVRRERKKSAMPTVTASGSARTARSKHKASNRVIRIAARAAGIDGMHCHRFRHTFADQWLSQGGSEGALMSIAGWSSREKEGRAGSRPPDDPVADEHARRGNVHSRTGAGHLVTTSRPGPPSAWWCRQRRASAGGSEELTCLRGHRLQAAGGLWKPLRLPEGSPAFTLRPRAAWRAVPGISAGGPGTARRPPSTSARQTQ